MLRNHDCKFGSGISTLSKKARLIIEQNVKLGCVELFGHDLHVGAYTYIRSGCELHAIERIGRFCSIANNVIIGLAKNTHPMHWLSTSIFNGKAYGQFLQDLESNPASIGHDCWIGRDVLIMEGVKIGNGAIIGARSVVIADVPPYAIVVGTPARIIRYRFDEGMIHRLEKIKWWNYPAEYLLALDFSDIKKCVEELEKTPGSARATYREICLTREGMSILDQ